MIIKIILIGIFSIFLFVHCGYYTEQSSQILLINNENYNFEKNSIGIRNRYNYYKLKYISKERMPDKSFENFKKREEYYKVHGIYETSRALGSGHGEIVEFEIIDSNPPIKITRILNYYDGIILGYINESGNKVSPRVRIVTSEDQYILRINFDKDTIIPAQYSKGKVKKGTYLEVNPLKYIGKLFFKIKK